MPVGERVGAAAQQSVGPTGTHGEARRGRGEGEAHQSRQQCTLTAWPRSPSRRIRVR
jgi:hypothetical protein